MEKLKERKRALEDRNKILKAELGEIIRERKRIEDEINEISGELREELEETRSVPQRNLRKRQKGNWEEEEREGKRQKRRQKAFTKVIKETTLEERNQDRTENGSIDGEMVETTENLDDEIQGRPEITRENETAEEILANKYMGTYRKSKEVIKTHRKELRGWYEYYEQFEEKVKEEREKYPKLGNLTIRQNVYLALKQWIPEGEMKKNLEKKTQMAKRIFELFEGKKEEIWKIRISEIGIGSYLNLSKKQIQKLRKRLFEKTDEITETDEREILGKEM